MDAVSVTDASGFSANGLHCGIKADGALDLTAVVAERSVPAAAVFTTSATSAPPVRLSRGRVARGSARAVIINSGSANAGTGAAGLADAEEMSAALARELGCDPEDVLVCSTGPIGGRLPVDLITSSVPDLVAGLGRDAAHATAAARGMMTTDSVPKQAVRSFGDWTLGGMSKGAGMIRPDMATMLAVLTTDAEIRPDTLTKALGEAVDVTFNALNIDGCQSTNDTVIVMASGSSGVTPALDAVTDALAEVCGDLSRQMAEDAEGASKVVTITVTGAGSDADARRIGMTIADSSLVRSSFYGADPNWGRVFGAAGVAGVPVDPDAIEIAYEGTVVASGGVGLRVDEDELSSRLQGDFDLSIVVGSGPGRARIVTTDLTPEYVVFNGERS